MHGQLQFIDESKVNQASCQCRTAEQSDLLPLLLLDGLNSLFNVTANEGHTFTFLCKFQLALNYEKQIADALKNEAFSVNCV